MSALISTVPAHERGASTPPETRRARRGRRDRPDRIASAWFVLPILLVFAVLTVIPLCYSIFWSFTDYNGYSSEFSFVGLANYSAVFADPSSLAGLLFTLLFAVMTTVLVTLLAIPLAVTLNHRFPGRDFARSLFFFLGVPSLAILGLVWQYILSPLDSGVLNSALVALGLEGQPWLSDPTLARFSVIAVAVWAGVGWHATLYLAYLQSVPAELHEQAIVDGANGAQRFMNITLPHLVPGIAVSSFLLMTGGLKVYELPYTLTGGGPGYATTTTTQSIILKGVGQSDYGVGSALAVLFTLATLIVIALQTGALTLTTRRFS